MRRPAISGVHIGWARRGHGRRTTGPPRYHDPVSKTSVEVDRDVARQAATILGTTTLRETINASLREVVDAQRRLELIALLGEPERFDFEATETAWGADE